MVGERVHGLTGGNQSLAAQRLGIPRRTFCRRLNEYRITFAAAVGSRERQRLRYPCCSVPNWRFLSK